MKKMKVVKELIKELKEIEAREDRLKNARTYIHSAIGRLRACPLDETWRSTIESDLFDAIRCLEG